VRRVQSAKSRGPIRVAAAAHKDSSAQDAVPEQRTSAAVAAGVAAAGELNAAP